MKVKILCSGSAGNCAIITDNMDNQLMLDMGGPYDSISQNVNFVKCDGACLTHFHDDHSKNFDKITLNGINIYHPNKLDHNGNIEIAETIKDKQLINIKNWLIKAIELKHNIYCIGFLIFNKIENKKIAYITDTTILKKLPSDLALFICECNYDTDIVDKIKIENKVISSKYYYHLNQKQIKDYFEENTNIRPKNLILSHLSNSGLIDENKLYDEMKYYGNNVYIAKKNLEIII